MYEVISNTRPQWKLRKRRLQDAYVHTTHLLLCMRVLLHLESTAITAQAMAQRMMLRYVQRVCPELAFAVKVKFLSSQG